MTENTRASALAKAAKLNSEAETSRKAGNFGDAERMYRQALEIYARFSTSGSVAEAVCRDNLGILCSEVGRLVEGIELHHAALEGFGKHGAHPADIAICETNLGKAHSLLGNLTQADEHLSTAIHLYEQLGTPTCGYVGTLLAAAWLYAETGDLEQSESRLRQALAMCRVLGTDCADMGVLAAGSLGDVLRAQGRYDEARAALERALAHANALPGELHPHKLLLWTNLGELYRRTGDLAAAEGLLEPIYAQFAELEVQAPDVVEGLRKSLGLTYEANGRLVEAIELLSLNVKSEAQRVASALRIGGEHDRMVAALNEQEHLREFLGIALRRQNDIEAVSKQALEFWLERKGLTIELLAAYRRIRDEDLPPPVAEKLLELRRVQVQIETEKRLAWHSRKGLDSALELRRQRLGQLQEEEQVRSRALMPLLPLLDLELFLDEVSVDRIASALPLDTALMEFTSRCPSSGKEHYVAFIVRGDDPGQVHLADLGPTSEVNQLVTAFRRNLAPDGTNRTPRGDSPATFGSSERLVSDPDVLIHATIADKLLAALEGVRRLIICPDASLCALPFHALPVEPDTDKYWIDEFEISYLATARDLLRVGSRDQQERVNPALILADPDYDHEQSRTKHDVRFQPLWQFDRLEMTREEGRSIGKRFDVKPKLGKQAKKSVVVGARSPWILHVATHGFFDRRNIILGAAVTTTSDATYAHQDRAEGWRADIERYVKPTIIGTSEDQFQVPGELSSMLSGGLAFAGANKQPEDGLLLAAEITRLELSGTEMVVLSSCETALGDTFAGEGVWGLQLAFRLAGTDAMIMSLWRVKDRITAKLMDRFYDRLMSGESKSSALRNAQLEIRAAHPRRNLWAPFICLGNGEPLTRQAVRAPSPQ